MDRKSGLYLAVAAAFVPFLIKVLYYPDYPGADDSFIHLGLIRNYARYGVMGLNPGEQVFMTTSPLFTLVMYWLSKLSSNTLQTGIWLSSLLTFIGLLMVHRIAWRMTESRFLALAAVVGAAFNMHLWRWSGTFMETTATMVAVLGVCWLYVERMSGGRGGLRDYGALGAVLGVATLLRPEAGILGLAFFAHDLLNGRKAIIFNYAAAVAGLALVLVPAGLAAYSQFGAVIPSTFAGKTSSGLNIINPRVTFKLGAVTATGLFGVLIAAIYGAGLHTAKKGLGVAFGKWRSVSFLLFIPLLAFIFFYLKKSDLQSAARYFVPYMVTLPILAAAGLGVLRQDGLKFSKGLVAGLLVLQMLVALGLNHVRVAPVLGRMWSGYVATQQAAADEVAKRCSPDDSVLVIVDIGVFTVHLDGACRMLDAGLLASPELKGLTRTEIIKQYDVDYVVRSLTRPGKDFSIDGVDLNLLWKRDFPSHGVLKADWTYEARVYEVVK